MFKTKINELLSRAEKLKERLRYPEEGSMHHTQALRESSDEKLVAELMGWWCHYQIETKFSYF
jgi:hypothetical protein